MKKQNSPSSFEVIILAAGLGTRMKSDLPKVLHPVCEKPMLEVLLCELDQVLGSYSRSRFNIVVGHGKERVEEFVKKLVQCGKIKSPVVFTHQEKQLGTGHAVRLALENVPDQIKLCVVFNGDLPLFTAAAFEAFLEDHLRQKSSASLVSAVIEDAGQYGRVLRSGKNFTGVVEFKDASEKQKRIQEYNGGVYLFDRNLLQEALSKMKNKNASQEFYLPDVFAFALKKKKKIVAHTVQDARLISGVNNMSELAQAQRELYLRRALYWMLEGVFLEDPNNTFLGADVKIGRGCVIGAFTSLQGKTSLADRVRIGAHCELRDVEVGAGSVIRNACVLEKSSLGKDCAVGPMAHFRPGSHIADNVKVGNFVEIKESTIGSHTSASHLSYIGDAQIGSGVNLGCGFITCNFDGTIREGKRKHQTVIGNEVFVGSDSQLVAPIEIADRTYIASGSSVTESVYEKDSLVIARTKQVTKPGYAKKYKQK